MANWCCFKFWFFFRLFQASLAHFNWFTAISLNCMFFTLWKTYDIFWFWCHLALCACFPALRPENYLLVFIRVMSAKCGEHSDKSFKEIHALLYGNQNETSAERELKRIETVRRERRETRKQQRQTAGKAAEQQKLNANESSSSDDDTTVCGGSIYPSLDDEEQAMPNIRVDRTKTNNRIIGRQMAGKAEGLDLINYSRTTSHSPAPTGWRRFVPSFINIGGNENAEQEMVRREKREANAEKRKENQQKLLEKQEKKERKRRHMTELRERAKQERRRKNFADAVDLLLTYNRLLTTFAVMVGHIHKTLLPAYFLGPEENLYDKPDLFMIFTITLLIDVGFFWLLVLWSWFKQMRLCCRLGCGRFLLWCAALFFFGGVCMLCPMHYVHEQLNPTWCEFEEGQPLSEYLDG